MNATTKTVLAFVFTLTALYLVLLTGSFLTGTPMNQLVAYSFGTLDGRDWMWVPVFFWAFIPTTMMLIMSGLAVWVSIKYSQKQPRFLALDDTSPQNADLHSLQPIPARNSRPEKPSRIAS